MEIAYGNAGFGVLLGWEEESAIYERVAIVNDHGVLAHEAKGPWHSRCCQIGQDETANVVVAVAAFVLHLSNKRQILIQSPLLLLLLLLLLSSGKFFRFFFVSNSCGKRKLLGTEYVWNFDNFLEILIWLSWQKWVVWKLECSRFFGILRNRGIPEGWRIQLEMGEEGLQGPWPQRKGRSFQVRRCHGNQSRQTREKPPRVAPMTLIRLFHRADAGVAMATPLLPSPWQPMPIISTGVSPWMYPQTFQFDCLNLELDVFKTYFNVIRVQLVTRKSIEWAEIGAMSK